MFSSPHGLSIHQSRAHKSQNLVSQLVDKVIDDGLMEAISLILFGTEDHWREISIAMNKKNKECFEKREIAGNVSYPFHRIVSGFGKKEFMNRQ